MNSICIGIISYLPNDQKVRGVRYSRFERLISLCKQNMPNIPIIVVAQEWSNNELSNYQDLEMYNFNKLGITGARENLRNIFLNTDYDWMICLDDDMELNINPDAFNNYLNIVKMNPDCFIEYENYLMNMCAMSKYIAKKYSFSTDISAEKGTGFEDWIYVSVIKKKDSFHYKQFWHLGLIKKPRRELVNDIYSTWQTVDVNKDDITRKSIQLINELSK